MCQADKNDLNTGKNAMEQAQLLEVSPITSIWEATWMVCVQAEDAHVRHSGLSLSCINPRNSGIVAQGPAHETVHCRVVGDSEKWKQSVGGRINCSVIHCTMCNSKEQ